MVLELTVGNVIALVGLVVAALWALAKLLGVQSERRLDERFDGLQQSMTAIAAVQDRNAESMRELEKELRRHQVEAARDYVRRDDFVRHIGSIETRIDNFALRMERALTQVTPTRRGNDD